MPSTPARRVWVGIVMCSLIPDVRIKDHGLESIEVVDNGLGIEQEDWAAIGNLSGG